MVDLLKRLGFGLIPRRLKFDTSGQYWEDRYASGGNSGDGSYGALAEYKATRINAFVQEYAVDSIVEFGCGDGNQLAMFEVKEYIGLDVSLTAVENCRKIFENDSTKRFIHLTSDDDLVEGDLTLSLDVIYHLIEDEVFETYMRRLFTCAKDHVIIYSSNSEEPFGDGSVHCRNRKFTDWVKENLSDWEFVGMEPNPHKGRSIADFHFFSRRV